MVTYFLSHSKRTNEHDRKSRQAPTVIKLVFRYPLFFILLRIFVNFRFKVLPALICSVRILNFWHQIDTHASCLFCFCEHCAFESVWLNASVRLKRRGASNSNDFVCARSCSVQRILLQECGISYALSSRRLILRWYSMKRGAFSAKKLIVSKLRLRS